MLSVFIFYYSFIDSMPSLFDNDFLVSGFDKYILIQSQKNTPVYLDCNSRIIFVLSLSILELE